MPIRNHIEAVVNQMTGNPLFLYGTSNELNVLVEKTDITARLVVMLYKFQPSTKKFPLSNSINTSYPLYVEFLFKTSFDEYTADNEEIIIQAEAAADEFMNRLTEYRVAQHGARYFRIKTGDTARCTPVYNSTKYDTNLTGVSLTMDLQTMYNDKLTFVTPEP